LNAVGDEKATLKEFSSSQRGRKCSKCLFLKDNTLQCVTRDLFAVCTCSFINVSGNTPGCGNPAKSTPIFIDVDEELD